MVGALVNSTAYPEEEGSVSVCLAGGEELLCGQYGIKLGGMERQLSADTGAG